MGSSCRKATTIDYIFCSQCLKTSDGNILSRRTIARSFKGSGRISEICAKKNMLTKRMSHFCRRIFWYNIVWEDSRSSLYTRLLNVVFEIVQPKCLKTTVKYQIRIMVPGDILSSGVVETILLNKHVNAQEYFNILGKGILTTTFLFDESRRSYFFLMITHLILIIQQKSVFLKTH